MGTEDSKETQGLLDSASDESGTRLGPAAKVGIAVGIVVVLAVFILVLVFLLDRPDTTETIRDLFIIVLALETLVIGTLLAVLIYQLIVLLRLIQNDLKPLIDSTQESLDTVKGTARFVSERVTKPAIAASGYAFGIGRSVRVLLTMLPRRSQAAASPPSAKVRNGLAEAEEGEKGNE